MGTVPQETFKILNGIDEAIFELSFENHFRGLKSTPKIVS